MISHEIDYKIFGDDIQLVEIELDFGETVIAEAGAMVYMENGINKTTGSLKSMVFGGEGLFLATLRGTGKIWLQSMPLRKFIKAISPFGKNIRKGSSSILGNFLER